MNNIQHSYLTIGFNFEKLDRLDLANDFYCKTLEEYSFFKYKNQEIYRLKNNLKSLWSLAINFGERVEKQRS